MRPSLLSAVALTIVALYALPAAAQDNQNQDTAEVEFEDQTMDGNTVVVARVVLPEGGFVVIHDDRLLDGDAVGSVVGVSEFLEAGEHMEVEVDVDLSGTNGSQGDNQTGDQGDNQTGDQGDNQTGDQGDNQTGTNDNQSQNQGEQQVTLIAMPHRDSNNNEEYDFVSSEGQDDGAYTQNGGGAVTAQAEVTRSDDTGGGLDQPGDDGFGDGQDDQVGDGEDDGVGDGEEDTPGFEAVALLALLGAIAVFRRR